MKNITIIVNGSNMHVMASDEQTVREVLEENNVTYEYAVVSVDGITRRGNELDVAVGEYMANKPSGFIGVVVKSDNAATVKTLGPNVYVESSLDLEDLKRLNKFKKNTLTMKDKDGNPTFRIMVAKTSTTGSISEDGFGVEFASRPSTEGKAYVTMTAESDDIKEEIWNRIGMSLLKLNEAEAALVDEIEKLNGEVAAVEAMVQIG